MAALRRGGISLIIGAILVGIAGIVTLATGNDSRFIQGCIVIVVVCAAAAAVMSGALFVGGSYPSRAAMVQSPAPAGDRYDDDPVDPETRARLNSVYPVIAAIPSVVVLLIHYL